LSDWNGPAAPAEEKEIEAAFCQRPLAGRRILIAEDNDINALLAGKLIEHLGGRSLRAANGREALDLLGAALLPDGQPFDLALFDMRMPELDGLSAMRQWRVQERAIGRAPLPCIALTANAFREDRDACLAAGFDAFLAKPIDRDAFVATVMRLLAALRHAA
jgi:CheY-like chemotaxis protein